MQIHSCKEMGVGQGEICDRRLSFNFIYLLYPNSRVPITQGKTFLRLEIKSNVQRKSIVEGFIL